MINCNFCGKSEDEVKIMIAGIDAYICEECILLSMEILIKQQTEYKEIKLIPKDKENVSEELN